MDAATKPTWGQTSEAIAATKELAELEARCKTMRAADAVHHAQRVARGTTDNATRLIYGGYSSAELARALRAARREVGAR